MTAEEKKAFRQVLQALGNFVGADGKIDWKESGALLGLVEPFEKVDADCAELAQVLRKVRADATVTAEE